MPRSWEVEEQEFRLDFDLLPSELNPNPARVRQWSLRNRLQYALSLLAGKHLNNIRILRSRNDGVLLVADVGAGFENYLVYSGTTANVYTGSNVIEPPSVISRWDILVEDADVIVSWKDKNNAVWLQERPLLIGFHSIDLALPAIRIKSRVIDNPARYTIVCYY